MKKRVIITSLFLLVFFISFISATVTYCKQTPLVAFNPSKGEIDCSSPIDAAENVKAEDNSVIPISDSAPIQFLLVDFPEDYEALMIKGKSSSVPEQEVCLSVRADLDDDGVYEKKVYESDCIKGVKINDLLEFKFNIYSGKPLLIHPSSGVISIDYIKKIEKQTICTETDEGMDYYKKGELVNEPYTEGVTLNDLCGDSALIEYYCDINKYKIEYYDCPGGCNEGACIPLISPDEETGPLDFPEEEQSKYFCNGCALDEKCYPFGYRKSGKFCSDGGDFLIQLEGDKLCENNFECGSNVCINDQCISRGLLQKILDWFRNIFS